MYIWLAFAVAAHLEPDILIVDEVLAVGDTEFQKKCLGKIDEVSRREGRTVLFVSHNLASIAELADRALLLQAGSIATDGSVTQALSMYLSRGARKPRYTHSSAEGSGYLLANSPGGFARVSHQPWPNRTSPWTMIGGWI
jgi:ABC-type polysaccharide/polyol phosphate transport system ATPase subunit